MAKKFAVGDSVDGALKGNTGLQGRILEIFGSGHKRKIKVSWENGEIAHETCRGINVMGTAKKMKH
jgi:hypothetical protein